MAKGNIWLIDATAFCYRAFYALPRLATSLGQPTGAVFGFVNMLNKILKEKKPEFAGVCFDVSRDTFRQEKFKDYKIQRPPMPDELSSQIELIKQIVSGYGIPIFEKEGYEADDVIATMAQKAKDNGFTVTIISSDKDMLQLVDETVAVFAPSKEGGKTYGPQDVREQFGIEAGRIPELIALMGDAVDNIPGIKGIGEKTAVALLKKFGSLGRLTESLEEVTPQKLQDSLKGNLDRLKLNMELAVLANDIDFEFNPERLKITEPDYAELFRIFKSLEFKAFLKNLPFKQEEALKQEEMEELILGPAHIKDLSEAREELIIHPDARGNFIFGLKDKSFGSGDLVSIKEALQERRIKKVGHDLKKIKSSLARQGINLEGLYFDTMVAAYLDNPSRPGYDLSELALLYLDKNISAPSLAGPTGIGVIRQLRLRLEEELRNKSLLDLFADVEMPLVEVLADMESSGIKLDLGVLSRLSRDLEKKLSRLIEDIYAICGCQFNINSPKQLRQVLFEKLKLPVVKRGKTGPSTDEEVLRSLAAKHELPAILLEYRQLTKLKSTYIDALPELVSPLDQRLHTSFNQTGTETGRLSSSSPNLQNIPVKTEAGREIRRAIIAFDEESFLVSADYSQVELRILAHISGDDTLISAFRKDKDIHRITASLIYGADEKDVTGEMRENTKRVNFGIIYGLTSFGLARDLGMRPEAAQSFIDAYFLRYPKVKEYIDNVIGTARKNGYVSTILGRRRYLPEINNKNQAIRQLAERQAVNTPIQGSASDLIKKAMIEIHRRLKDGGFKTAMILQVHDELVFNVPEEEKEAAVSLIKDCMENVLRLDVPVKVDIKIGRDWLEMEPALPAGREVE